ncbi:hypothetical protein PaeCFBP13512_18760 [Paenibacillus sp. CFBP13512]|uniref:hypothetical protein n=1 Tax=Paenibacillus sp. CFBP13512 TaxID=2184007 RepID=UPI0010C028F1|nr:hypothetical protein [Paenibacillus sp. CFBP13512]TKJ87264.1 hypothetical protein PaeCFBP13512_18760 [Paenibacillus sp. CFBP13512]
MQENLDTRRMFEGSSLIDISELAHRFDFTIPLAVTSTLQEELGEDSMFDVVRTLRTIINFDPYQSTIEYGVWTLKKGKNSLTNVKAFILKTDQDNGLMIVIKLSMHN